MGKEIEHKYLVEGDSYKGIASRSLYIVQGYLCREPERTVRVRTKGEKGYITVKGITTGCVREEFEYEVPVNDAREMLRLCVPPLLEKTRWIVPFDGFEWEVDEFHGSLSGLVTAEIELPSSDTPYSEPAFLGRDVTGDPRYSNSNLSGASPKPT